jgi:hypothetical protein
MVGNTNADELSVRQLNRLRNQDFGFVFQQSSSPPTPPCSTMWCCP